MSVLSLKQLFVMVQVIAVMAGTSASDSHAYDELPHYDLQSQGLRGSVRTVITRYSIFVTTQVFDRAGRLAKMISDTTEKRRGWPSRDVYHYNELSKPDSVMVYGSDDRTLIEQSVFAYDEGGNPSLKITVRGDGSLDEVVLYGTNEANQIIAQFYFDQDGAFKEKHEYRYDDANKLVLADIPGYEVRNIYRNNTLVQEDWYHKTFKRVETVRELNEVGDSAFSKSFASSGAPLNEIEYSYKYDASSNWIRQTVSQFIFKEGRRVPDGTSIATRDIDYYEN